jgi:hypothetical protein
MDARAIVLWIMQLLLILFAQTVPYEYPYYQAVRREVWFVPVPDGVDRTTYERRLHLEWEDSSSYVIVKGTIEERWLGEGDPLALKEVLNCDSVATRRDTLVAYSSLRFVFTKLDAEIHSIDLMTAMRYADDDNVRYKVDEVLDRLGLGSKSYKLLVDGGSLISLELRQGGGVILVNLSTGAVVSVDILEPQVLPKRSCLFRN